MTLVMYDAIYPATLPPGGDAYLGYVDGRWPTIHGFTENGVYYPPLAQLFPGKHIIGLTVTGATLNADGCDIETGDLNAVSGALWLKNKLAAKPAMPPVAYCSVASMAAVVAQLAAIGVPRTSVLLLSAHYGDGEHICGPSSCNLIDLPQDGTQWTDTAPGVGAAVDRSLLADHFFTTTPAKKENQMDNMLIIWGTDAAYLLHCGKLHKITPGEAALYQSVTPPIPSTTGPVATAAEIAALLTDFPPGQPVVTVPPVTIPPVTVTVPPLTINGTITPAP